ncbi:MAG: DUF2058 family protein [Desulfobacter sp.]|nr:DUF2058 family protein [Desulfobacter sp.]WDP84128.1 MAG: DUF2058 family protein [Desulfobacter sp.]
MGLSLQDQLLKAGIADKKQAKKAKHEKRVKRKKNKGKKISPEINQTQKDQAVQARRSQELNRQLNREKARLEKLSQVRQLIETNRLKLDKYEAPYYFKVGKKIKKLYVNEDITKKLSRGDLAIVSLHGLFEIVPGKVAQQIAERDQEAVVVFYQEDH